jgi:pyridinium-3,5-bisthiocarboxylic acid mononucleotide nickel chelatase
MPEGESMSPHRHEADARPEPAEAGQRQRAAPVRIAYFDCFAGISGDMTLGALLAAGVEEAELRRGLESLGLPGWELCPRRVQKHAITATDVTVIDRGHGDAHGHKHEPSPARSPADPVHGHSHPHGHGHHHAHEQEHEHEHEHEHSHNHTHGRGLSEILAMIRESSLPEPVKERASAVFQRLGEAEAKIHDVPVEAIHFHEVGAVDSIIDIVGSVLGLHLLGVERIVCSPLPAGHGFVRAAHGLMPIPAPATMELLKGIPVYPVDVEGELVTPTGAALMASLADEFGRMPPMRVETIGYGAGKKEFPFPNLLRVCIGMGE